jgi:hypothetical protein
MLSKKRRSIPRSTTSIVEARAGVIFASDYVLAELDAATSRVSRALRAHAKSTIRAGDHRAITDMLIDLRHYCDSKALAFDELNAVAEEHYWDEKAHLA